KTYTLVKDVFPNTFELLQSNDIYEAPKMGALWRYAISKDFIMMPENFFGSDWIKEKLGVNNQFVISLKTGLKLSRMVEQDYSYKSIITSLYMYNKGTDARDDKINVNTLVSILYCLNEELLKPGAGSFIRLQFNDLLRMNDEEFEIMISLLDMKYNNVFQ